MRLTLKDKLAKDALNQERYRYGTDFLQNLIFCNGFPVIVKGKYDIASREENRLIFMTIRPYNETVKTMPKICSELVFPIDSLWKARILKKADYKEPFYIIGRIKVVYKDGRPKGTIVLAEDVYQRSILTENQFTDNYPKFSSRCYKWPVQGEVRHIMSPVVKRMHGFESRDKRKKERTWNRKSAPCYRKKTETETQGFVNPVSNPIMNNRPSKQDITHVASFLPDNRPESKQKQSTKKAAEPGRSELKLETQERAVNNPDVRQLMKAQAEEHHTKTNEKAGYSKFFTPLGKKWLLEFETTETTVEYAGCTCSYLDGIIYIDSHVEEWQLRYSTLFERTVLYHKNKRDYAENKDREPVEGYHVQYIQSMLNLNADDLHEFRKPQDHEFSLIQNIKGQPAVKDYIDYICQHRELAEKRQEKFRKNIESIKALLADKNVSYEIKQKKKRELRKILNHANAIDVLELLKRLESVKKDED